MTTAVSQEYHSLELKQRKKGTNAEIDILYYVIERAASCLTQRGSAIGLHKPQVHVEQSSIKLTLRED